MDHWPEFLQNCAILITTVLLLRLQGHPDTTGTSSKESDEAERRILDQNLAQSRQPFLERHRCAYLVVFIKQDHPNPAGESGGGNACTASVNADAHLGFV